MILQKRSSEFKTHVRFLQAIREDPYGSHSNVNISRALFKISFKPTTSDVLFQLGEQQKPQWHDLDCKEVEGQLQCLFVS